MRNFAKDHILTLFLSLLLVLPLPSLFFLLQRSAVAASRMTASTRASRPPVTMPVTCGDRDTSGAAAEMERVRLALSCT